MSLRTLLQDFTVDDCVPEVEITGLSLDSRRVVPGDLFIALSGHNTSGTHYINDAIANGARACMIDSVDAGDARSALPLIKINNLADQLGGIIARFYKNPSKNMKVIGITGTNGKTSCAHFIAQAFHLYHARAAVLGTVGNGVWPEIAPSPLTTLDAVSLQKHLALFVEEKVETVAMEVSSHALVQQRVAAVDFNTAIFTGLTHDHLDYHGSMQAYAQAKFQLFQHRSLGYGIVNCDDDYANELLESRHDLTWYGYSLHAQTALSIPVVTVESCTSNLAGMTAVISSPWGFGELTTSILGEFNLANLLAVVITLCLSGIPFLKVLALLSQLKPVTGRMECLSQDKAPLLVVDYAHTPDALAKALQSLKPHCEGKLWCLFGCGGNRDRAKRVAMAAVAEQHSDCIIITSDNPREESQQDIAADIMSGFSEQADIMQIEDRKAAIAYAVQCAKPCDIVLLAGKGHETTQVIGAKTELFSDQQQARHALLHYVE